MSAEAPPGEPPPPPEEPDGPTGAETATAEVDGRAEEEAEEVRLRTEALEKERAEKEEKRKAAVAKRPQKGLSGMKFDFANLIACKVEAHSSPTLATTLKGIVQRVSTVEDSTKQIEATGVSSNCD